MHLHASRVVAAWALVACASLPAFADTDTLARFEGGIGVDPLTAAGGVDVPNVVRGVNPGGRAWMIGSLRATVGADGSISAKGRSLLFTSGELIGTPGPVTRVGATLACGPADATAALFHSPAATLDADGDFHIKGRMTQDGVNDAVMPATCDNPVLLIRAVNASTGAFGGWFAAGIPRRRD